MLLFHHYALFIIQYPPLREGGKVVESFRNVAKSTI